jgi:hypothetical protein
MTAKKPTSDEQFGTVDHGDDTEGHKSELDQMFDHHNYSVLNPGEVNPTLSLQELEDLGAEETDDG